MPAPAIKLSEPAQAIAQAYAVFFPERPGRSKALQWINRARREKDLPAIKQQQLTPAINELAAAGLIAPPIEVSRGVRAQGPSAKMGTITRFCALAVEIGTAQGLLQGMDEDSYEARRFRYEARPPHFLQQHLRVALLSGTYDQYAELDIEAETFLWLSEPAAAPYLKRLPEKHRQQACEEAARYLIHTCQSYSVFNKTCTDCIPDLSALLPIAAFGAALQGDLKTANKLTDQALAYHQISKAALVEALSVKALIQTLSGNNDEALKAIQTTLEAEKQGTRKKLLYPATTAFSMAIFALLKCKTPEADQLFSTLLTVRQKLKMESFFDGLYDLAQQARKPTTPHRPYFYHNPMMLTTVLQTISSRWHTDYHLPADNKAIAMHLQHMLYTTRTNGYAWLAAETQGVIEAMYEDTSHLHKYTLDSIATSNAKQRHTELKTQSLLKLVETESVWEYQLRSLERLTPQTQEKEKPTKKENQGERRLKWILDSYSPFDVSATPIEQSSGKNGTWSSGRKVALKRLKEDTENFPHLIEQDRNAAATILKQSYGWHGSTTYETNNRTVYQLIGHPHVYDPNGVRLSVQEKPAQLCVHQRDSNFVLTTEPAGHIYGYICKFDAQESVVSVTHVSAAQQRICEAIPFEGIEIPIAAEPRLQALLKSLSATITIQGDRAVSTVDVHPGISTPLLELARIDDQLSVRVRVEPLTDSNTYFDAGLGGEMVYVQTDQGSVPVQRELALESEAMQSLIAQSPVLSRYYDGRNTIIIDGLEHSLELISELQETNIRCIWPKGIAFTVAKKADTSQLQLNIRSADEWFRASGELRYNNKDALSLNNILTRMQDSAESHFIELDKNSYLALSRSLHKQLSALQAFSAKDDKDKSDTRLHPAAILALEPLFNSAKTKTDKKTTDLRKTIKSAFSHPVPVPATLKADLRSYQLEGYEWLARLSTIGAGACLADDMGLGKTVQTLTLLLSRAKLGPALVVAPTSVIGNWASEAQRFAPSLNVLLYGTTSNDRELVLSGLGKLDVMLISYGLMTNDSELLQNIRWSSVVLDEAQAIKNANTKRARAAKALVADFRMITTGTPVQNNLMDLHSLFSFSNPDLLGSQAAFRRNFATSIERDNNPAARKQLKQLVSPFMLRRHKRDVLQELPARTEINLSVTLSGPETVLYETLREEALASLKAGKDVETQSKAKAKTQASTQAQLKFKMLTYLTKLRRLCCNPKLLEPDWTGPESKLELCIETLQDLLENGHKALVFSQFVDHLSIVEKRLKAAGISYQYLDGSTPSKKRTERVNAFQSGQGDVFLISLTAGGTGLNLTAADYVLHLDPWWNPAVEDQASDRAHRFGQQRPVTIYRMVTAGTIEEQIQKLHGTKRDLAESVLSGAESTAVNTDELIALLQHSSTMDD